MSYLSVANELLREHLSFFILCVCVYLYVHVSEVPTAASRGRQIL